MALLNGAARSATGRMGMVRSSTKKKGRSSLRLPRAPVSLRRVGSAHKRKNKVLARKAKHKEKISFPDSAYYFYDC